MRRPRVAAPVALPALVCLAVVAACLAAPLYARHVARADPFRSAIGATVEAASGPAGEAGPALPVLRENTDGLGLGVTPIGPRWRGRYALGADMQGRDVAARLLYAGRYSLGIAAGATLLCLVLAGGLGVASGFVGGWVDLALGWLLDVLWAFPVTLLAISLSLVLASQDIRLGGLRIGSDSLALPVAILGVVFVPYVARPVRSRVRGLLRADFVRAAGALGVGRGRILARHLLPFALATLADFAPLVMGLSLMAESALSFLQVGVRPPATSWGAMVAEGQSLLYARPMLSVAPGAMIVVVTVALNLLGDAMGDAAGDRA